jgi:hypothetical protein
VQEELNLDAPDRGTDELRASQCAGRRRCGGNPQLERSLRLDRLRLSAGSRLRWAARGARATASGDRHQRYEEERKGAWLGGESQHLPSRY